MEHKIKNLQSHFRTTVQNVNERVQGLNANINDSATRIKQQLATNSPASPARASPGGPPPPSPPPVDEPTLRLPVSAARKLRWYDQADLKLLIKLHLQEKSEWYEALRVAHKRTDAQQDGRAQNAAAILHRARSRDDAVAGVLALSAQAEIEQLRERLVTEEAKLRQIRPAAAADAATAPLDDSPLDGPETQPPQDFAASLDNIRRKFDMVTEQQALAVQAAQDVTEDAERRCQRAEAAAAQVAAELKHARSELQQLRQSNQTPPPAALASVRARESGGGDSLKAEAKAKELEALNASLGRQLDESIRKIDELQSRAVAAEAAVERAMDQVNDLQSAAAERDELAGRLSAAEARLDECRVTALTCQSYREIAQQAEVRYNTAEEELVVTAALAASLETRLAEAQASKQDALLAAERARVRAHAAEAAVDDIVRQRWAEAGSDRALWPETVASEFENLEALVASLRSAKQNARDEVSSLKDVANRSEQLLKAAEKRAAEADERTERLRAAADQRERRLEAAVMVATRQAEEFRAAMLRAEKERDEVLEQKHASDVAALTASQTVAASTRRAGSGAFGEDTSNWMQVSGKKSTRTAEVDAVYMKNVILKFLAASLEGRAQECELLLPAVAAVLKASPTEFKKLKEILSRSQSMLGWLT